MKTEHQDFVMPALEKRVDSGLFTYTLRQKNMQEYFITANPVNDEKPEQVFRKAAEALNATGAEVVCLDVFGLDGSEGRAEKYLADGFGDVEFPTTWVEGGNSPGLYGLTLWAVSGTPVKYCRSREGTPIGAQFEDDHFIYGRLGDVRPAASARSRVEQARSTLEIMAETLEEMGLNFSDVVRTWFYNRDILDWYGEFNACRDKFFHEKGVFDCMPPASTGIGGHAVQNTDVLAGVLAVRAKSKQAWFCAVPSPLQCPALEYGSSFSRAAEIITADYRRLIISGTASIEPGGETVHVDDVAKQIALTMEVVYAIMESRGMGWGDVTRAVAYIKDGRDEGEWLKYCDCAGLRELPAILTGNIICRDDLLFEIELDAITPG